MQPVASPDVPQTRLREKTKFRDMAVRGLCALSFAFAPLMSRAQEQTWPFETQRLVPVSASTSETYFGTVRASKIFSLSYGARGCIVEVSESAKDERVVQTGQVLVKLDDQRSQLALRTAAARISELATAIEERQLAIEAARADDRRRKQELELVSGEFERSSVMLGRGLINETTMDAIQRRFMEANFAVERATEAIANAETALKRAEIALEIGKLDMQSEEINLAHFLLAVPFDGVLVGFDANVGDCVQEGELAARIYAPDQKSVDVFFRISQLTAPRASGLSVGAPVKVTRINGQECQGTITRIDTEAETESQFVETTVDVDPSCAPNLFLNESVEIEAAQIASDDTFRVPNSAIDGSDTVFLVDEDAMRLVAAKAEIISRQTRETTIRIPDAAGRLLVMNIQATMADGLFVGTKEPG
ncbi:MAG: HlyD family efflux transporter periplasmic adaptor subunit [Rhodobacter sp.]|nr:HlyD family efflux transporter periplasmic adaptor subunit [Rhodobacter sp.]